jgi:uncharacterized protein (TIGR03083 family)
MLMFGEYLGHLDAESHLLAAAAARGLEPLVPGCPGWTVRDLVVHTARVQRHKAEIVARGLVDVSPPHPELPEGADPIAWFREGADRLYRVLAAADPFAPAKTFADEQTVGFWIRRMAHEALIHRVDAEQAHGYESGVDPDLALDGIDELLEVFATRIAPWGRFAPTEQRVAVAAAERTWILQLGRFVGSRRDQDYDLPAARFAAGTPDATVHGDPDRVLLWMWGRSSPASVAVTGRPEAAAALREACTV